MEWKTVRYEAGQGVGLITLNRPDRSNAWTADEANRLVEEMIGSDDYRQGIKALIDKRPPGFAARYTADPGSA